MDTRFYKALRIAAMYGFTVHPHPKGVCITRGNTEYENFGNVDELLEYLEDLMQR